MISLYETLKGRLLGVQVHPKAKFTPSAALGIACKEDPGLTKVWFRGLGFRIWPNNKPWKCSAQSRLGAQAFGVITRNPI